MLLESGKLEERYVFDIEQLKQFHVCERHSKKILHVLISVTDMRRGICFKVLGTERTMLEGQGMEIYPWQYPKAESLVGD